MVFLGCDLSFKFFLSDIMFKNTFQSGFLSILYSIGSKPLQIWDKTGKNIILLTSEEWTHQETYRSGYPKLGAGNHGDKR